MKLGFSLVSIPTQLLGFIQIGMRWGISSIGVWGAATVSKWGTPTTTSYGEAGTVNYGTATIENYENSINN